MIVMGWNTFFSMAVEWILLSAKLTNSEIIEPNNAVVFRGNSALLACCVTSIGCRDLRCGKLMHEQHNQSGSSGRGCEELAIGQYVSIQLSVYVECLGGWTNTLWNEATQWLLFEFGPASRWWFKQQIPGNMCHRLLALGYVDLDIAWSIYTLWTSSSNDFEGVNFLNLFKTVDVFFLGVSCGFLQNILTTNAKICQE